MISHRSKPPQDVIFTFELLWQWIIEKCNSNGCTLVPPYKYVNLRKKYNLTLIYIFCTFSPFSHFTLFSFYQAFALRLRPSALGDDHWWSRGAKEIEKKISEALLQEKNMKGFLQEKMVFPGGWPLRFFFLENDLKFFFLDFLCPQTINGRPLRLSGVMGINLVRI